MNIAGEEKKIDQIIDGSFWNLENNDFENFSDEKLGNKTKELLEQLKPYYRENLFPAHRYSVITINLNKELKAKLKINPEKYKFIFTNKLLEKRGIIDCSSRNLWIPSLKRPPKISGKLPSIIAIASETTISLKILYDQKIKAGLNEHDLEKLARSKDLLDQCLFLYIIKRAQNGDELAANLIYKQYEEAALKKATYWRKLKQEDLGVKFKTDGELGEENVKNATRYFLRMLIMGDNPELLIDYIKKLEDDRNIEILFTRNLGKKIRNLVKQNRMILDDTAKHYKNFEKIIDVANNWLLNQLSSFDEDTVYHIIKKNNLLPDENNEVKFSTSENLNERQIEKSDEQKVIEIFKKYNEVVNPSVLGSIHTLRLKISTFSNPLVWFEAYPWFNNKVFDAKKNNNFSNWLLGGVSGRGALIELLNNWINNKYFMKNVTKREFKEEFLDKNQVEVEELNGMSENPFKELESDEEKSHSKDAVTNQIEPIYDEDKLLIKINEYGISQKIKDRDQNIIYDCIQKNLSYDEITYQNIADKYNLSRSQVLRIWQKFRAYLKN